MLVIDASVAIKWYVEEEGSDRALPLMAHRHELIAPRFLTIEFASVMWKLVRRGTFTAEQAGDACRAAPRNIGFFHAEDSLIGQALDLAVAHNHPVYDCLYVALAIRENAALITADRRLSERFAAVADIRLL